MRVGRILSINHKAGVGLISDCNGEHIRFLVAHISAPASRGDLVTFEIYFLNGSLRAAGIAVLKLSKKVWPYRYENPRIIHALN